MQLKLEELHKVVKKVVKEEKAVDSFRNEISRALGPTVLVSHGLQLMAESANDRLDFLKHAGQSHGIVKTSTLLRFVGSESPEVRKLVARLLPENFLKSMMRDKDYGVRGAVAERLPHRLVAEMTERFPNDDQLKTIERSKRLTEAGLPDPESQEDIFDMYGEFPLGTTDVDAPGLNDQWYKTLAHKIVSLYGGNIEGQWEELSVKRYCDSLRSFKDEIDQQKLLDNVYEILDAKDDAALEESFKGLAQRLREEDEANINVMPVISEAVDPVETLLESGLSSSEYVKLFEELFEVQKGSVSNPGRKQGILESVARIVCPVSAKTPRQSIRSLDERAIDTYVKCWNTQRDIKNQPFKMSWSPDVDGVNFHVKAK